MDTQQPLKDDFKAAQSLIREFEGFVDHAYPDVLTGAAPWTIGYGFTHLNNQPIQPGQTITLEEALTELQTKVIAYAEHLSTKIPHWGEMNINQRCALIDFAWNLGPDFFGDQANFATITRELEQHNWQAVPQALLLYRDPGSSVEVGLLRRRRAEAALWQRPVSVASSLDAATAPNKPLPPPAADGKVEKLFTNPLKVPYCDQELMADQEGYRECFSASSAMLAMYWGKEANENTYDQLRARYDDTTLVWVQLDALRSLGLEAHYSTDGTPQKLKAEIDAGRPVAVGWLHHGPVSHPIGGHWIVIIGYDANGFFVNDPEGNCDLVNGGYISKHDGAGLHYSYTNWLPRWQVDGKGGWYLTCSDSTRKG